MKRGIKAISILLGMVLIFICVFTNKNMKAIAPAIEIKKVGYDEVTNELTIGIFLKGGTTLKSYNLLLSYDYNLADVTAFANGEIVQKNDNVTIGISSSNYGGGELRIKSPDATATTTEKFINSDEELCRVKFKIDPADMPNKTILEENGDVLDNIFDVDSSTLELDGNDSSEQLKVSQMSKIVSSIDFNNAEFDKTEYKHKDNITLTKGQAIIHYDNAAPGGETRQVNLETMQDTKGNKIEIQKGPWTADLLNPNVHISYRGHDSNSVAVNVVDFVESMRFIAPTKVTYEYGEDLDISTAKVYIKMASKTTEEEKTLTELINSGNATVTGFDSTLGEGQKITENVKVNINYLNYPLNKNFDVTITDKIKNIEFVAPTKTEYKYKEEKINLENGKIIIELLSGKKIERSLRLISGASNLNILTTINQALNLNDKIEITGFDTTKYGAETITIKYYYDEYGENKNKTFTYEINIASGIKTMTLNNNSINIPYGHEIEDDELVNYKINIEETDGSKYSKEITADMITYNKFGAIGTQNASVNYNGEKIPFKVTLTNFVKDIKLSKSSLTILYGDSLDENTLTDEYKIIPIMANGQNGASIRLNKNDIFGEYDTGKIGTYNLKVNYIGKEADFELNVIDKIIGIKLDDEERNKIKAEYKYNEALELNEAKLTIVKLSGETKIDLTNDMIKNYNPKQLGNQELDIQWEEQSISKAFEVNVEDYIVDIVLVKPNKTTYLPKEKLDLTGASVRTLSASGVLGNQVAVTGDMISGYNEEEKGTQNIKVNYEGFEKDFDVIMTVQTGGLDIDVLQIFTVIIAMSITTMFAIWTITKTKGKHYGKM